MGLLRPTALPAYIHIRAFTLVTVTASSLRPIIIRTPYSRYSQKADYSFNSEPVVPDYGFAFDIDGVLQRSSDPLPRAKAALSFLQKNRVPFILLTNGGGKHESERISTLSGRLGLPLDVNLLVQSHTPYADFHQYKKKTVLVVGGEADSCQKIARAYGFQSAITPGDILVAHPEVWPLAESSMYHHYKSFANPLPKPINPSDPARSLKIDAIFVYNDSRDWALDSTVILDVLLSQKGILGTLSEKNGNPDLPNKGYQQDDQPTLYFSNPDLWWAAKYHLPRLGQGGFREALRGLWTAITGGPTECVELQIQIAGKPYQATYEFAEKRLRQARDRLFGSELASRIPLRKVFMVGDNPESDIRGGNSYQSPFGTVWRTALVKTGVHRGEKSHVKPSVIVEDVYDAVKWAVAEMDRSKM